MVLTSRAKSAGGSASEGATGSRRIRAKGTRVTRAERWAGCEGCEYISQRPRGVMPTKKKRITYQGRWRYWSQSRQSQTIGYCWPGRSHRIHRSPTC